MWRTSCLLTGWRPRTAFDQEGLAAERSGRDNILADAVAYNQDFSGREFQGFEGEAEYCGVRLSHTGFRAFDHCREAVGYTEIGQHGVDVSIEVRDECERISPGKSPEHHG